MDLGEIYGLDRIIGHFFLTSHEIQHSAEYRYEYYFPHNCSVYLCKNRIGVGKQISEMYVFISILSGKENFFDKGRKKGSRVHFGECTGGTFYVHYRSCGSLQGRRDDCVSIL